MNGRARLRRIWLSGMLAVVAFLTLTMPARAATDKLTLRASIDGRALAQATERRPIRLYPSQPAELEFAVTNRGRSQITIRTVRLEGRAVGLTFFAYETAVGLTVAPGKTEARRISLDLSGLRGQASGLLTGSVKLLDGDRRKVATQGVVVDVRGSIKSVYGLFGLGVAALTAVTAASALMALRRNQLSPNRWWRGTRFLTIGFGAGLVMVFTLSALRVFVPKTGRWLGIVLVCSVIAFAAGYVTPAPEEEEEDDDELEGDQDLEPFTRTLPSQPE